MKFLRYGADTPNLFNSKLQTDDRLRALQWKSLISSLLKSFLLPLKFMYESRYHNLYMKIRMINALEYLNLKAIFTNRNADGDMKNNLQQG